MVAGVRRRHPGRGLGGRVLLHDVRPCSRQGRHHIGVCTNTLCAVLGGDAIWASLTEHLGVGHDETTADGKLTLERIECQAACTHAPVLTANWEFVDNVSIEQAKEIADTLRADGAVASTRGPSAVRPLAEVRRVFAGFDDGLAGEGVAADAIMRAGTDLAASADSAKEA